MLKLPPHPGQGLQTIAPKAFIYQERMIFLIIIIIIKEIVSKMGCDLKKKITVGEFSYFIILNGKKKNN